MQHATWQMIQAGACLPGVVILFFWLFSGEVKHFVHLIRLNLNNRLCPCGLIDHGPVLGVTHDYLGVNWVPLILCCWFLFRHKLVPHSVPNLSPVPLCNVSWGLGVSPVLVRSVSPCRLALEVRLFPSPPCAVFGLLPVVCVRFFSSSCLSGLTRLRPGVCVWCDVCVCNIWTDVQLLQGARGRIDGTGQRRPIYIVVQTYLQFSSLSSMATG